MSWGVACAVGVNSLRPGISLGCSTEISIPACYLTTGHQSMKGLIDNVALQRWVGGVSE